MASILTPMKAPDNLTYLIHHIFLPPKVPTESDYSPEHERFLLGTILESLGAYEGDDAAASHMLRRMHGIHVCSAGRYVINEPALVRALEQLHDDGMSLGVISSPIWFNNSY
jgi:hypothetical protein